MSYLPQFRLLADALSPRQALKYASAPVLAFAAAVSCPLYGQTSAQPGAGDIAASISGSARPEPPSRQRSKDNRKAEEAYIAGARLLDRHDPEAAEREFARAVALAPDNRDYTLALSSVRDSRITELVHSAGKARLLGRTAEAEAFLSQARAIDPHNAILLQHPDAEQAAMQAKPHSWIVDGPGIAPPIAVKPTADLKTLHIRAAIPEVVRQVAAAYGLKASLDSSLGTKQLKFDLENVSYAQAMHLLMDMGSLFVVPLAPDTILAAKDTTENRQRFEHQLQETIFASGKSNEQLAELGNMIKSVFEIKQVSVQNSFGTLVVRAPESTMQALNLTLADLLDGDSQIMLDLKLYSIDKTKTRNIGVTVPNQAGAYNVLTAANQLVQANQSLVDQAIAQGVIPAGASNIEIAVALLQSGLATSALLTDTLTFIGGGITATGIYSSGTGTLNLALNSGDSRALDEIQLRVGDRQSATFRAGSKYPITQSTYSTTAASSTTAALGGATVNGVSVASLLGSLQTSTTPQVQYEDLGVTLKATPVIQKSGMISLHLDLKIESLAGGSVDNIPILNNNQFTSDVTVPDGGTAFLVSNMTQSQSAAVTGIPGLSELPGFQSSPQLMKTTDTGQLLMLLTPHLTKRRINASVGPLIPISLPANAAD